MKIIATDNFDRDYIDDRLICENLTEWMAKFIVDALNKTYCNDDNALSFYKVVPDEYKLKTFEP